MNTPFGKGPSPLGGPPGPDRRWPPFVQNWREHVAEAFEAQSRAAQGTVITPSSGNLNLEGGRFDLAGSDTEFLVDSPPSDSPETPTPEIMLPALVVLGDQTDDGRIIELVMPPWFDIVALMRRDPDAMYQFDWRKWEEIVAGAYKAAGFDVVLTPASNDRGRDVIATRDDVGSIRVIDQVKAYSPGHLVLANDVRALIGVLSMDSKASKGIITTTSDFAPGVYSDPDIQRLTPSRLELRPRDKLIEWLDAIVKKSPAK